jgi:predicted transcriptional regulator
MPKTKLSDILKNGEDFKITSLSDISKEDLNAMLKSVEKEKKIARERVKNKRRR